jgi:Protein of unknown function (DUF3307)
MSPQLLAAALPLSGVALTPFERGLVAHLVADWLLQNNWMAKNKSSLVHPAAWVHALIHAGCLTLALGWTAGVVLGLIHLLVDTRVPLNWWMRKFKNSANEPEAKHIEIWADQVIHIVSIAAWISIV